MTNREAFILVGNFDLPAGRRGPRHSLVVCTPAGEVVKVYRYKGAPGESEKRAVLAQHPGCLHLEMEAGSCRQERTLGRAIRRAVREAKSSIR